LSGTRTTAPAAKVVASATDEPATKTMAAPMGGASHLANGSLELDLMLMTSPSLQSQLLDAPVPRSVVIKVVSIGGAASMP
jgi:hypothetical protein